MGTTLNGGVIDKLEIGDMSYTQTMAQFPAQEPRSVVKRIQGIFPVVGFTHLGDIDPGVGQVTGDVNCGNGDKSDAGITQLTLDQISQLALNLFPKPTGTTKLFCHSNFCNKTLERALNLHPLIDFDLVTRLDVVIVLNANTALRACLDLIDVILETTQ